MVYSGFSTQNNYVTSIGIVTVSIPFVIPTYKGNIVLELTGEKTCKILKASDSIRAIYKTIVCLEISSSKIKQLSQLF